MQYANMKAQERAEAIIQQSAEELLRVGLARADSSRFLLGITGPPAGGKSTFAAMLSATLNKIVEKEVSIVVPMDGFHLPNEVLEERGLLALKGAPETFDVEGFVELLGRLREDLSEKIWCPSYDRKLHSSVSNAIEVDLSARIIIVEGNYLLLNTPLWDQVRGKLDQVWYLDTPREVSMKRMMQRHLAGGRTEQEAIEKIEETDIPNTNLIEATCARADRIVRLSVDA